MHVVQEGEELFTFFEEITGADETRMHGETEEQWHERMDDRIRPDRLGPRPS